MCFGASRSTLHTHNSFNSQERENQQKLLCAVIGIGLAAIAGVAAYYSLVNGIQMMDFARSSLETFTSGFLIYMGLTFSVVAVGNFLYSGCRVVFAGDHFEYSNREAINQIAISIFAPVAVIPAALCCAISALAKS